MSRKILVADLLCGAGGSSTGCERALRALGLDMELVCVNHWQTAIDTHTKNHPNARHVVQDIATVRPHLLVPEGYLDLLMASPTCTHHSVARGGKPTSDQQRSDPWHIITWLTELRVKRIIIENVWEFTGWGPVDSRTGKPVKSRKGEYFQAWIDVIRRLGYEPEWRKLNAADYGDATTRQRFILMARNDRRPVFWPPPTHVRKSDNLALFPTMQSWKPAREIIDWSLKGRSIFNRKKPLAPKTLARIHAGAVKFGWPEPFLVVLRNHMNTQSVGEPVPTIAANGKHIGLAQPVATEPFILSRQACGAPRSTEEPMCTQTAQHSPVLISPYYGSGSGDTCKSADVPLDTVTSKGRFGMVVPITHTQGGNQARDVGDPVPTMTTAKGGEFGIVVPVTHAGGETRARGVSEPLPTIATGNRGGEALAEGIVTPVSCGGHYDILFRMLEPHELAAAMGFTSEEHAYEFAGTKTEQIKQIGNAVSVSKMRACVGALMADAAPQCRAKPSVRVAA